MSDLSLTLSTYSQVLLQSHNGNLTRPNIKAPLHASQYVFFIHLVMFISVTRCSLVRETGTVRSFKRKRLKRSPGTFQTVFFFICSSVTFSHSNALYRFPARVGLYVHRASRATRSSSCVEMLSGWRTAASVPMVDWWATYTRTSWVSLCGNRNVLELKTLRYVTSTNPDLARLVTHSLEQTRGLRSSGNFVG